MLRYLKEAFWARPRLTGLGAIPWNALAVAGVAMVGFAEPAVWAAGAGLEAMYLYTLATNPRFQNWVDATHRGPRAVETADPARALDPQSRARLTALQAKQQRVEHLYRESAEEDFLFESNRDALRRLVEIFTQLLVARRNLLENGAATDEAELRRRIAETERELAGGAASETLRESREATLNILRQRLRNLQRREQTLAEIDSDLTRIEAQFELAIEDATLKGRPAAISANIGLVSHLLDDALLESGAITTSSASAHELEN
ncbi:MAG TPA: hypothetical protein VF432_31170 [Thermoanaerobaculia bacterium]